MSCPASLWVKDDTPDTKRTADTADEPKKNVNRSGKQKKKTAKKGSHKNKCSNIISMQPRQNDRVRVGGGTISTWQGIGHHNEPPESCLCCTAHKKKLIFYCQKSRQQSQWKHVCRHFIPEDISFFCLAPNVSLEPKFGRPDMTSLVHSRECAKTTAFFVSSFGADLVAEG